MNILFQNEFATNTTTATLLKPSDSQLSSSTDAVIHVADTGFSGTTSRKGKAPRLALSEHKEAASGEVRSRMQEARVALGEELFGGDIKTLASIRLARGYSQLQLARAIGSSQPAIAKMEAGATNLQRDTMHRLTRALGLSMQELDAILTATESQEEFTAVTEHE